MYFSVTALSGILSVLLFSFFALQDLLYRRVSRLHLLVFVLPGLFLYCRQSSPLSALPVFLPGLLLLLFSHSTGGAVGRGDGLFLLAAGLYLPPVELLLITLSGIFLTGLFSIPVCLFLRCRPARLQRFRLPFIPFLYPAFLFLLIHRADGRYV